MTGCLDCGRDCHGARCDLCSVEHNAVTSDAWDDDTCPECDAPSPGGIRCGDCLPNRGDDH